MFVWCVLDNLCYHFALAERTRARVEDAGRVELAENEANAMARSKEIHIFMIVVTVLLAVYYAGDAWPSTETGERNQRIPTNQMVTGFVLPVIGLWAVGAFEATEPALEHRNKIFGLHNSLVMHTNRFVEIALRIGWTVCIRFGTIPIMGAFFGTATWGFGSNWAGPMKADEEVTRAYWEKQGTNWTSLVYAAVAAGHAPDWNVDRED